MATLSMLCSTDAFKMSTSEFHNMSSAQTYAPLGTCWNCPDPSGPAGDANTNQCLASGAQPQVFLIGDSHAVRLYDAWKMAVSPKALQFVAGCSCSGYDPI